jgi:uncharacterized repeat protein (TIGR01451 family)
MMQKINISLINSSLKAIVVIFSVLAVAACIFYASGVLACGTCCFDNDCGAGNECVNGEYCRKITPSCISICTAGTTKCADTIYYSECVKGSNGCYTWGYPKKCAGGNRCDNNIKSTTFGTCQPECENECTGSQKVCATGSAYKYCGLKGNFCFQWINVECGDGKKCQDGECVVSCTNECSESGKKTCSGNSIKTCGNYDSDSCLEYKTEECPDDYTCSGAQCVKTCADECVSGAKRCAYGKVQVCGNYDSDSCQEWGGDSDCPTGKTCTGNGECACTSHFKKQCENNDLYWYDSCGNKEGLFEDCGETQWTNNYRCALDWTQREKINRGCSYDQCYETREWINQENCDLTYKKCDGGRCVVKCTDECTTGAKKCTGNGTYQLCGNFDTDDCSEWSDNKNCAVGQTCQGNGICEHIVNPVTVDLTGPSSIVCQDSFTLTWTSTNAFSCVASGDWSGNKAVNGSLALGTIASPKTYTITCAGEDGTATDSVSVTVSGGIPAANAGPDAEVYESQSETLNGSATGGGTIAYAWTCNGGTVENASSAVASFKAPSVSQDIYYVCTLKTTNNCGFSTDTMNVLVKNKTDKTLDATLTTNPKSGCVSLKNVDLTADAALVGGSASDEITYSFDCTNDGTYEKTVTTTARKYTAADLCTYATKGSYTAAVKATAIGLARTATATVSANKCGGGGGSNNPSVALDANPDNGCAPLKNVDLYAEVYPERHGDGDYTYYFYCDGDDEVDKKVTTEETSYTAKELCDYSKSGTYTAYVRVESDNDLDVKDSATISVEDCESAEIGKASIDKLASNLSDGTAYSDSISAKPGDVVSFKITVKALGGDLENVILADVLPTGIFDVQNITVDGIKVSDSLASGIDLGDIASGQSKTVIFTTYVGGKNSFDFGQTVLTNTAKADCDTSSCSDTDTAIVKVTKTEVEGATTVSTGFTNNPFVDSFVIPAGFALFLIWAFKAKLIKLEEWLDQKKQHYLTFKSRKALDLQRAKLKAQKIADRFV